MLATGAAYLRIVGPGVRLFRNCASTHVVRAPAAGVLGATSMSWKL